jgi:hypothetical protein
MRTITRLVASVALFVLYLLIPLGCIGLGGLLGFGLTVLSSHGVLLKLLGVLIGCALFWMAFVIVKWFGLLDLRGQMGALGYIGASAEPVLRGSMMMHRPWWLILLAIGCSIFIAIKNFTSNEVLEPWIRPGERIPFTTRATLGAPEIAYLSESGEFRAETRE